MSRVRVHDRSELPQPRVEEVSSGIYAYVQPDGTWWLNNTGFLVGRNAVTAIDSCATEVRTRALLDTIGRLTEMPVRTLVNTHSHGDHTHGNCFLSDATIIGHELCRREILAFGVLNPVIDSLFPGVEWGELVAAPPAVTFTERMTIHVDELEVQLIHLGPAHTDNDLIAWIPDRSVLFAGDLLFNGGTPNNVGGSIAGTLEAIQQLRELGAQMIVPGHGPLCDVSLMDDIERYMCFVQQTASEGVESGLSPLEAARGAQLGEFGTWSDPERLVGNLHRAYTELAGGEVALMAAYGDMVAYNGGPLRCLA
jgi:cyclase